MNGKNITTKWSYVWICSILFCSATLLHLAHGDEEEAQPEAAVAEAIAEPPPEPKFKPVPPLKEPWVRLGKGKDKVWINQKTKQVAVDGEVSLTKGYLEMFACILGTKEHESVVALHSKAFVIHTALLAIGAEPGTPANWRPKYEPAKGPVIKVEVEWYDEKNKLKRTKGQQWVRDLKTKKAVDQDWVFAGSLFYVDSETQKRYYRAEGGEIICVSNFPVSMMDLPIESSQANDDLAFEAFTENIPRRRTPVRMYLTPQVKAKKNQPPQEKLGAGGTPKKTTLPDAI